MPICGIITPEYIQNYKAATQTEMSALSDKAAETPMPTKDDAFKKEYIYANVATGGDVPARTLSIPAAD